MRPSESMAIRRQVYGQRGLTWAAKSEYDKAIKDYNEAIRLNPRDAVAFANRGISWVSKGEYDKGIKDYNEAIRLNPNNRQAVGNRGNAWYAKKEYDKAIKDYDEAIRLGPKDWEVFFQRGQAWEDKEEYDKAIKDYGEVIRLEPNNTEGYRNLAFLLATCDVEKTRDGKRALELAKKAAELTAWKDAEILTVLAAAYAELGQFDDAVKWEQKALEDATYNRQYGDGGRRILQLFRDRKPLRNK